MGRKIVIKAISNSPQGKDASFKVEDEWVCLANEGTTTEDMEHWILLNCKPDNKHYDHYYFPATVDGRRLEFAPGQLIFVITGHGKDYFIKDPPDSPGQYHLYQQRDDFIWNQPGDRARLYSFSKEGEKEIYELVAQKEIVR